ncbi:transposase [Allobaculum sp. JKK-2023]|uniref:transposase n=1 Tax=Allobaculum sp. JKK-2023 TaxID=3108943 RepID=UPI002B055407|nr:transposase [Allobaculum sp. JKK-2023]
MLTVSSTHQDFLQDLNGRIAIMRSSQIDRLNDLSYAMALGKVTLLNLDPVIDVISHLYSSRGRPAADPRMLIRSLVLMYHFQETSIQLWHDRLEYDFLLRVLCGISGRNPAVGTYYSLMDRLYLWDISVNILPAGKNNKPKKAKKPKGKPGRKPKNSASPPDSDIDQSGTPNPTRKGEKMNLNPPGATTSLAIQAQMGEIDPERSIRILQALFKEIAVEPSIAMGLIDPGNLILSGDGTAVYVHANNRGHHLLEYTGTEKFDTLRRYSDPDASIGFDSDKGDYYFGFTGYFNVVHNSDKNIDLPIHFMIESAREHDSTISIKAINQVRHLYPNINITHLCLDSASDNEATFQLCENWSINPVIDLNKRRGKGTEKGSVTISSTGKPICKSGEERCCTGFDKTHNAYKYRCPYVMKRISECSHRDECSKGTYGLSVYLKCNSARERAMQKHGTKEWKTVYNNRTSCERLNNRCLNDYGLHKTKTRTQRRISFVTFLGCVNIHTDAWLKEEKAANN